MNHHDYRATYEELYQAGYHRGNKTCRLSKHEQALLKFANLKPGKSCAIDIGCSYGSVVKRLKKLGYNAYGIDVAKTAIKWCIDHNLQCKVASATNIPLSDSYFTIALSSDMLEHLHIKDVPTALAEIRRVLVKGGLLYAKIATAQERRKHLHLTVRNHEWWRAQIKAAKFKSIRLRQKKKWFMAEWRAV